MPEHRIPCPACENGSVRVRKSGALFYENRTGLLVRECLVECRDCKRKGKMLVTLDIAMFLLDEISGLYIDPKLFPTDTAA